MPADGNIALNESGKTMINYLFSNYQAATMLKQSSAQVRQAVAHCLQ